MMQYLLKKVRRCNLIRLAVSEAGEKPKVAIVGSSFIGMEMAAVLVKQAHVTVIGMEKVPFERTLGKQVGTAMQELHEKSGIVFKMEANVDKLISDGTLLKFISFWQQKTAKKWVV
jgi:NAD(P)H-nitrite reductase large subunit